MTVSHQRRLGVTALVFLACCMLLPVELPGECTENCWQHVCIRDEVPLLPVFMCTFYDPWHCHDDYWTHFGVPEADCEPTAFPLLVYVQFGCGGNCPADKAAQEGAIGPNCGPNGDPAIVGRDMCIIQGGSG